MKEIKLSDILEVNAWWLIYRNENKEKAYLDLSASANSFARATGYSDADSLRCVGRRYRENGVGYYEFFNIGHTRIVCPLKPGFLETLTAKLSGKDPVRAREESCLAFEKRLNEAGWKTEEIEN